MKYYFAHWGRVTHICVGKLTIIGSDNGLSPGRRQAIIWTNAEILLIGPLGTNFSEILIAIETFSFKKMHLKISSAKWRPFCLGLNVLNHCLQHNQSTQRLWICSSYATAWHKSVCQWRHRFCLKAALPLAETSRLRHVTLVKQGSGSPFYHIIQYIRPGKDAFRACDNAVWL